MSEYELPRGGGLDLHGTLARCTNYGGCGWEGVPTSIEGVVQLWCPNCERPETDEQYEALATEPAKVGRNAPCPCGSGRKFKKCCE